MSQNKPRIKEIRQIIPAEAWSMAFKKQSEPGEGLQRLACWALCIDENGNTFVTGMIANPSGTLTECYSLGNFRGYMHQQDKNA